MRRLALDKRRIGGRRAVLLRAMVALAAGALTVVVHLVTVRAAQPQADEAGQMGSGAPSVLTLPSRRSYRMLGGVSFGRGIRFNNPFRLQTQLGDDSKSLSLTASYLDLWAGVVLGGPEGLQHGMAAGGSIALGGIRQEVVTPSYLVVYQPAPRWLLMGRAGLPVIIEPDANVGFEVAARGGVLLTGSLGLTAELVASLFYGAATLDVPRTAIPIVSMQLGAMYQYEVLP